MPQKPDDDARRYQHARPLWRHVRQMLVWNQRYLRSAPASGSATRPRPFDPRRSRASLRKIDPEAVAKASMN